MERERDRSIEQLLRETLKRQPAATTSSCLDAETAAAWMDGALSSADRANAEAHAASCARCQALMASLARVTPPPTVHSWFRLPRIAWLAPLTAALAALIIWAAAPAPMRQSAPLARADSAAPKSNPEAYRRAAPMAQNAAPVGGTAQVPTTTPQKMKALADREQPTSSLAPKDHLKEADAIRDAKNEKPVASTAAPAEAAKAAAPSTGLPAPASAAAPPPAAPPAPEPSRAAQGGLDSVAAAPPSLAAASMRKSVAENQAASADLRARLESSQLGTVILSPNQTSRWRIFNRNADVSVVEHSTDSGSTWRQEQTNSTKLSAGASPSPSVCWMVGVRGVVLLTTDARTWSRLVFPETIDLVAVRASDDRNATVTAIDGRTFTTTDRGVTWSSLPRD